MKTFTIPGSRNQTELSVSYTDISAERNSTASTVLYIPGVGCEAGRLYGSRIRNHATQMGVRVLIVDRFGYGKTTMVPKTSRISEWVRLVPLLLEHLQIEHVALVGHSAGIIYLLNTLFHHRHLLDPERPFVALLCPWVDPSASGFRRMRILKHLPVETLLKFCGLSMSTSDNDLRKIPELNRDSSSTCLVERTPASEAEDISHIQSVCKNEQRATMRQQMAAMKEEVLLCLKIGDRSWGACDDYQELASTMAMMEEKLLSADAARLRIELWSAGRDSLVGAKGRTYMEKCWANDAFEFHSSTLPVCHNCLPLSETVLSSIFKAVGGMGIDSMSAVQ